MSDASAVVLAIADLLIEEIEKLKGELPPRYHVFTEPRTSRVSLFMNNEFPPEIDKPAREDVHEWEEDTEGKLIAFRWWPQLRRLRTLHVRIQAYRHEMMGRL